MRSSGRFRRSGTPTTTTRCWRSSNNCIDVLIFDPKTGERRLRLIEEQDEYNRIRRLHPQADEMLLRAPR
jgi:hypothetical protein